MKYILILPFAALQFLQYLFEGETYFLVAWSVNDFTIAALASLVFFNSENTKQKCLWAIFAMWRVVIFCLNIKYIDDDWPVLAIIIVASVFILFMRVIVRKMPIDANAKLTEICKDNYYFVYRSQFTWLAFLGSFLPRTRYLCSGVAICTKDELWCVSNGMFVKVDRVDYVINMWRQRTIAIHDSGVIINKHTNDKLDSFVGKVMVPGLRDCMTIKKLVMEGTKNG